MFLIRQSFRALKLEWKHMALIPLQTNQSQQRASFKNQTKRFKLPPVPKEKQRTIKKKKPTDSHSSTLLYLQQGPAVDDVWSTRYHPPLDCTFLEAVSKHREFHHPEMTDNPDTLLRIHMTLDLTTNKKTKFIQPPQGLVLLPHNFDNFFPSRVLAITRSAEEQEEAEKAGAIFIGGQELIKKLEKGEIKNEDFDHVVMSESMLVEASVVKKILKDNFPSKKNGNLGSDISYMVQLFRVGKEYQSISDSEDEANITFAFGKLDMTDEELLMNVKAILQEVASAKSRGRLFKRLQLSAPPSKEVFNVKDDDIMPVQKDDVQKTMKKTKKNVEDAQVTM